MFLQSFFHRLENAYDTILSSIKRIKNHPLDEIIDELKTKIDDQISAATLMALTKLAIDISHLNSSAMLILKCFDISISQMNYNETSKEIIFKINENKHLFAGVKSDLTEVLRAGFISTNSSEIKQLILKVVELNRIKTPFKKKLEGEDLEFYKNWIQ